MVVEIVVVAAAAADAPNSKQTALHYILLSIE